MKWYHFVAVGVAVGVLAPAQPAAAADAPATYVFGTYYRCNEATETQADTLFKDVMAPLWQKQVDAKHITAFGWSRHWMGGAWRRLEYVVGNDVGAIVDARDEVIGSLMKDHAKESEAFSNVCSGHDDYLWVAQAGSQPPENMGQNRPAVGMTTYFQCNSQEDEADAIVKTLAPVLDDQVKQGNIASWVWLRHMMGGKYRRALVLDGKDHKSMLEYWNTLGPALTKAQPELFRRFGEICDSHSDYIWDLGTN